MSALVGAVFHRGYSGGGRFSKRDRRGIRALVPVVTGLPHADHRIDYVDMYSDPSDSQGLTAFCFAHISDPHLTTPPGRPWPEMLGKRGLGYIAWRHRGQAKASAHVLDRLIHDLHAFGPDHTAITGDLTNLGTPEECREGAAWLASLGHSETVSFVPGNHDRYVPAPWSETLGQWQPWTSLDTDRGGGFPFVRCRGPVAFIGVSSSVPTAIGMATGWLGQRQRARLRSMLDWAREAGYFRVLMIHHPPLDGVVARRKRLVDAPAVRRILASHGAEMVLHGHAHRFYSGWLAGPDGAIRVLGAPGASDRRRHDGRGSGYYRVSLEAYEGEWYATIRARTLDSGGWGLVDDPAFSERLGPWRCGAVVTATA